MLCYVALCDFIVLMGDGIDDKVIDWRICIAGPPESLSECNLLNQTADSLHVACRSNDDGGLKQTFQLQALDVSSGLSLVTLHSDTAPEFRLSNLEPGSTFMLYLYAVNAKGSSAPVVLPVSTLKEAAKRTVPPTTDTFPSNVASAVAMGTAAALLLISSIALAACIRYRRHRTGLHRDTSLAHGPSDPLCTHEGAQDDNKLGRNTSSLKENKVSTNGACKRDDSVDDTDSGFCNHQPVKNGMLSSSPLAPERRTCLKLPLEYMANIPNAPESSV